MKCFWELLLPFDSLFSSLPTLLKLLSRNQRGKESAPREKKHHTYVSKARGLAGVPLKPYTHLEEPKDQPLVHLRKNRKSLLIGQENAGGENGCFDGFPKPTINDMIRWKVSPNFKSYTKEKKDQLPTARQDGFPLCFFVQDLFTPSEQSN